MADAEGLRRKAEARYAAVAQGTQDQLVANLREAAPVGETGNTRDGVRGHVDLLGRGRFRIVVEDDEPAAKWTDAGTRAHVIRPRQRVALRWTSGAQVRFAKVVHHPGYKGTGWWRRQLTAQAVRQVARNVLARR